MSTLPECKGENLLREEGGNEDFEPGLQLVKLMVCVSFLSFVIFYIFRRSDSKRYLTSSVTAFGPEVALSLSAGG